jgi:hypothetical protein
MQKLQVCCQTHMPRAALSQNDSNRGMINARRRAKQDHTVCVKPVGVSWRFAHTRIRRSKPGEYPMSNAVRPMPGHVEVAYKEVVNNIFFIKRQQWVTTNYTILVYAAIFIISARFFTRTDLARGWLGLLTFLTFFYHLYMIKLFQDAITSFRDRLAWIYRTYFSADEQAGLNLSLRPDPYWHQAAVPLGLIGVSMVGAVLTLIYLFSVR